MVKIITLIFGFICLSVFVNGQDSKTRTADDIMLDYYDRVDGVQPRNGAKREFVEVDENSKSIPDSLQSYDEIAKFLTRNLSSEKDKFRALYIWIAHNIEYDIGLSGQDFTSSEELVEVALKNRRGVCSHYARMFDLMSKSIGLTSYLIVGYTTADMAVGHAWNGVKIDSNYYFVDVTWAAGYAIDGEYFHRFRNKCFMTEPKKFIRDHMPFDPIWQFLENPVSPSEFVIGDFNKLEKDGNFMFADSIAHFESLNELAQLESSTKRMISFEEGNALLGEESTLNQYNLAILYINKGVHQFNFFNNYKYEMMRKVNLKDGRLKELIDSAYRDYHRGYSYFKNLRKDNEKINAMVNKNKDKFSDLDQRINAERDYIYEYISKGKLKRFWMFLNHK